MGFFKAEGANAAARKRTNRKLCALLASMSRKGNCWGNAVTETLFGSLQVERLHDRD